MIKDK
jgi:ribosomal protein L7/L12